MTNNYTNATVTPWMPKTAFTELELNQLSEGCGLTNEDSDGHLYFFAEEWFTDEGEDADGNPVICTEILQEKLKGLEFEEYPHIIIEGACYCGKMRPGEFGGFAYFITREEVRYVSTWSWLNEMEAPKKTATESAV
jgi:hypothetical protein